MDKEEFKKEICDIIDTMDESECEKLSLQLSSLSEEQNIAQELIKINGEFKKLTKIVYALEQKDEKNIDDVKPYIQMYKFMKDSRDILFGMPNISFFNISKFSAQFGSFKYAYQTIEQIFADILNNIKLQPLAKFGDKFDARYHEIVESVNDINLEDETIVEVLEQGFIYKNTLINYAKVKVNKKGK